MKFIRTVKNDFINLEMVASIDVHQDYSSNPAGFEVRAVTPTSNMEVYIVYDVLFAGTKEECDKFMKYLEARLMSAQAFLLLGSIGQ